jgi:hypothetical protein
MLDVVMELIHNGHSTLADPFNLRIERPTVAMA